MFLRVEYDSVFSLFLLMVQVQKQSFATQPVSFFSSQNTWGHLCIWRWAVAAIDSKSVSLQGLSISDVTFGEFSASFPPLPVTCNFLADPPITVVIFD